MANSRDALAEARSARAAVESLAAGFRQEDDENHRRRGFVVLAVAVVLAAVSVWLILRGSDGFRDPSPVPTYGSVGVAVDIDGPPEDSSGLPLENAPIFGVAGYFDPESDYAEYTVFFPERFVGRRYALLLADGAVLREVRGGMPKVVPCRESGGSGDTAFSIDHRCQVFYGTVPARPSVEHVSEAESFFCDIDELPGQNAMPRVSIEGRLASPVSDEIDWAHTNASFPGMGGGMSNEAVNRWHGVALDRWYATGLQKGCKVARTPANTKITDSEPGDVWVGRDALGWYGEDALRTGSVVVTERDIQAGATTMVAVGGALIGLAVGLVPVVYEAFRAARRR